jgi:hypothetical protein
MAILKFGRFVSYCSSLLLVGVAARIQWKSTRDLKAVVFTCAGIVYFHVVTLSQAVCMGPESGGMLFSLAGIAVIQGRVRNRVYIAASLFMVAFLFKQSFIAAPISVFIWLLVDKKNGSWVGYSAWMAVSLVAFYVTMAVLTGGNHYFCTIKAMSANDMMLLENLRWFGPFLLGYLWPVLLSLSVCVFLFFKMDEPLHLLHVYFAVSLVWVCIVLEGRRFVNYLSEFVIVGLIVIGTFLGGRLPAAEVIISLYGCCRSPCLPPGS